MLPEPTMQIINWAATRTAEAIVGRVADRLAKRAKTRVAAAVGFAAGKRRGA